jgi:TRAP-type C4-dicarboxylate transport system permease small subunit
VVLVVFDALTAALFALLAWGMLHRTLESYSLHEYSSSPLGYLLAPSFAIVVVGSILMVLRTATASITGRHPSASHSTDVDSY